MLSFLRYGTERLKPHKIGPQRHTKLRVVRLTYRIHNRLFSLAKKPLR
jgi:hypothetical protein